MNKKIVLLGTGLTGNYLIPQLEKEGYDVFPTSRSENSRHINAVRFDLGDKTTWRNLPLNSEIIWIFPPVPVEKVREFLNWLPDSIKVRLVLGTTSVYVMTDGIISEESPVDETSERVQSEKLLLKHGAVIFRCSGLYSSERHPYQWLKKGLIKNGNKVVNLIHLADLAKIMVRVISKQLTGKVFNISDGKGYLWKNIVNSAIQNGVLEPDFKIQYGDSDCRYISNQKIVTLLNDEVQFHNEGWFV